MGDRYAVSAAEWARGALEAAKLARLAHSFARDGAVVLENCLPHAVLDALSRRMDTDAAHQLAESKWEERGARGAGGHLQQGPPRHAPYVHREIVANMFLEQAATAALGGGVCHFSFYNGNTNLPASGTQQLHFDQGDWHWPDRASSAAAGEEWPHLPVNLVVNFSTEAIEPTDGPTQLYLGSHLETACATGGVGSISDEMLRRRNRNAPPVLNCLPKGAASFRDLRLWVSTATVCPSHLATWSSDADHCCQQHRGTPNTGTLPRHMLAICYSSARSPDYIGAVAGKGPRYDSVGHCWPLLFSGDARPAFSRDWWPDSAPPSRVDFNVQFTDQPVDHFGNVGGSDFWLPAPSPPSLGELGEDPPEWAVRLAGGDTIRTARLGGAKM